MNKQAFLDLIKEPNAISKKDREGLDEVIANFPYFQAAHVLMAKLTSDEGNMLAEDKIKKAGAYSLERKSLKNLLYKKSLAIPEVKKQIQEAPAIPEKEPQKFQSESFFEELQKNIKVLHETKTAAKVFPVQTIKESPAENKIEVSNGLITESLKEHSKELNLFTSRLDEVIGNGETNKKSISEAELLLNYLSYLKNNKTSVVRDKKKSEEIIDKFIKEEPSIASLKSVPLPEKLEDKASESYILKSNTASETLANMMVLQKKYEKAIEIYQELSLKYPEKRAYFTSQIEKIKGNK